MMRESFPEKIRHLYDAIEGTRPIWTRIDNLSLEEIVERSRAVAESLALIYGSSRDSGDLMALRKLSGQFESSSNADERQYSKSIDGFIMLLTKLATARIPEFIRYETDPSAFIESRMASADWDRVPQEIRYLESPAERFWRADLRDEEPLEDYVTGEDVEELRAAAEKFLAQGHARYLEEQRRTKRLMGPEYEKINCLLNVMDELGLLSSKAGS